MALARTPLLVDGVRTASGRGKRGGALSERHPVGLLAETIAALVARTGVDAAFIDDVYAGCVSQAGEQTMNVARLAALTAGLPYTVPGTTIDRQCGSSLQALRFAEHAVRAGDAHCIVVCGVESMSRVPLGSAAMGADPVPPALHERYLLTNQGVAAERIAQARGISRTQQDAFAAASHALAAGSDHARDIVTVDGIHGPHSADETVRDTTAAALAALQPAFATDAFELEWSVTAGNSSPLTDGAAAVLVVSDEFAAAHGLLARARIRASVAVGSDPSLMLDGVIPATSALLAKASMALNDIDAFEVNEAFAVVPLAWLQATGADQRLLNRHGGAIALGHPLGASGARIITTLMTVLDTHDVQVGFATMCEGGGMANATIIERL